MKLSDSTKPVSLGLIAFVDEQPDSINIGPR